jgi:hypothetical protein
MKNGTKISGGRFYNYFIAGDCIYYMSYLNITGETIMMNYCDYIKIKYDEE